MRRCSAAVILCWLSSTVRAQDRCEELDSYVREALPQSQIPGLAMAVVKDGELVLARGYGERHLGRDALVTAGGSFGAGSSRGSAVAGHQPSGQSLANVVDQAAMWGC